MTSEELLPDTNPGRRKGKRRKHDALLMTALAMSALALVVTVVGSLVILHSRSTILHVQDGRKIGVVTTCGTTKALVAAGRRRVIAGALLRGDRLGADGRLIPGPLSRRLPELGTPAQRQRQAVAAADDYERGIVEATIDAARQANAPAPVRRGRDGQLHIDCQQLVIATRANEK